jgi:hypothetical protein
MVEAWYTHGNRRRWSFTLQNFTISVQWNTSTEANAGSSLASLPLTFFFRYSGTPDASDKQPRRDIRYHPAIRANCQSDGSPNTPAATVLPGGESASVASGSAGGGTDRWA